MSFLFLPLPPPYAHEVLCVLLSFCSVWSPPSIPACLFLQVCACLHTFIQAELKRPSIFCAQSDHKNRDLHIRYCNALKRSQKVDKMYDRLIRLSHFRNSSSNLPTVECATFFPERLFNHKARKILLRVVHTCNTAEWPGLARDSNYIQNAEVWEREREQWKTFLPTTQKNATTNYLSGEKRFFRHWIFLTELALLTNVCTGVGWLLSCVRSCISNCETGLASGEGRSTG